MAKFIKDEIDIAEIDCLGHDNLADSILTAIELAEPPFTFAIYGSWGTGKTKLMERAKCKLEEKGYTPILFDTWEYESEPNLIWPLLKLIREKTHGGKWGKINKEQVEKTFKSVSRCLLDIGTRVSSKVLSGGILEYKLQDIEEQLAKEDTPLDVYQDKVQYLKDQFNEYIKLILKKTKQDKLIIFFDDLDRCSPDKMIELLESVKLFLYRGNCIFVFALDKKIVSEAITKKYIDMDSFDGERYLEKIFEFSFNIPPPSRDQLGNIVEKQYRQYLPLIIGNDNKGWQLLDLLKTSNRDNPRVLKRFFNKLMFLTQVHRDTDELKFETFAWVFVFEFWPGFRKLLNEMGGEAANEYIRAVVSSDKTPEEAKRNLERGQAQAFLIKYSESQKYYFDPFLYHTLHLIVENTNDIDLKFELLSRNYEKTKKLCEKHGL